MYLIHEAHVPRDFVVRETHEAEGTQAVLEGNQHLARKK